MYYAIYFSPTYNTEKACRYFCCGEYSCIDLIKNKDEIVLREDDVAVIGVPSYAGRVPSYALSKLKKIKGNGTKAILISSYGNRASEDTLIELFDAVKENGFLPIAGMELVAPHSIFKNVAANRPDGMDYKDYANFKIAILKKLEGEASLATMPGNRPYKEVKESTLVPICTDSCVDCKACSISCPTKAISYDDVKITNPSLCIHCMRCTAVCKFDARVIEPSVYEAMSNRLMKAFEGRKPNNLYL